MSKQILVNVVESWQWTFIYKCVLMKFDEQMRNLHGIIPQEFMSTIEISWCASISVLLSDNLMISTSLGFGEVLIFSNETSSRWTNLVTKACRANLQSIHNRFGISSICVLALRSSISCLSSSFLASSLCNFSSLCDSISFMYSFKISLTFWA